MKHLAGVGDRAHEFLEWTGYAYHVRRRLTEAEQAPIGPALDLRGSDEGWERLQRILDVLPPGGLKMAAAELFGNSEQLQR